MGESCELGEFIEAVEYGGGPKQTPDEVRSSTSIYTITVINSINGVLSDPVVDPVDEPAKLPVVVVGHGENKPE